MEEFELEPGENIIRTVRQNGFVLVTKMIPFLLFAFIPVVLHIFFALLRSASPQIAAATAGSTAYVTITHLLIGVWLLFLWMAAFSTFIRYYMTMWVITNTRIVDIKQYGFFRREVSSFLLIRVQDITTEINGMIPTLIGYGHLHVETAGNDESFSMTGIAHPQQLRDLILGLVAQLHPAPSAPSNDGI